MKDDWDDFKDSDAGTSSAAPIPEEKPAAPVAKPAPTEAPKPAMAKLDDALAGARAMAKTGAARVKKEAVGFTEKGRPLASKLVDAVAEKTASKPAQAAQKAPVQRTPEPESEAAPAPQAATEKPADSNRWKQPGIGMVAEVDMAQDLADHGATKAWTGANNHNLPLAGMALVGGVILALLAVFVWPGPKYIGQVQSARVEAQATGAPPNPPPTQLGPTTQPANTAPVDTPPVATAPAPQVQEAAPAPAPAPASAPTAPATQPGATATTPAQAPVANATPGTPLPESITKDLKLPPPPPVEDAPVKSNPTTVNNGSGMGSSGSSGAPKMNRPKQATQPDNWDARRREAERFLRQSRGY